MTTYTAYIPFEDIHEDDLVVARGLSGPDAIKTALEYDGSWHVHIREDEYDSFRVYEWRPVANNWPYEKRWLDMLCATVVKTADFKRDKALGMSMIVEQFMRRSSYYWKGCVETDQKFEKRLLHIAKRREVHRVDREIRAQLRPVIMNPRGRAQNDEKGKIQRRPNIGGVW